MNSGSAYVSVSFDFVCGTKNIIKPPTTTTNNVLFYL